MIKKKLPAKAPELNIDQMLLTFLTQEFTPIDPPKGLQPAVKPMSPPLCILKSVEGSLSVWYRLPLKGVSGAIHLPDFIVFKDSYRVSPRDKNPDIIIECRNLPGSMSNRTDPRVVQEVIGRSLELMPATSILVTNREISGYAKAMAEKYGIGVIELDSSADPGYRLFKMLISDDQPTREKFLDVIGKGSQQIQMLHKRSQRKPNGALLAKRGGLHERLIKALVAHPGSTAIDLSKILGVHEDYIMNTLYKLEKEHRAKIVKRSNKPDAYKHDEWQAIKVKA